MNTALPLIALIIAGGAYALDRRNAAGNRPTLLGLIGLGLLLLIAAKLTGQYEAKHLAAPTVEGLSLGIVLTLVAEWLGVPSTGFALGVAFAACTPAFGEAAPQVQLALMAGAMAGVLVSSQGKQAAIAGLGASLVVLTDSLGRFARHEEAASHFGSILGLIAAVLCVLVLACGKRVWTIPVALLVLAGGIYLAATRMLPDSTLMPPAFLGVLAGLVVTWLLPNDEADPLKSGVATVIWLSLATIAYTMAHGFGMAVSLIAGLAMPVALGRWRAVLTSGPLMALVLYRLFGENNTSASTALDIGQHYALVGFSVGAVYPAVYEDWKERATRLPGLGGFLWVAILAGTPAAITLLIETKGLLGFATGLGFGGLLLAQRAANSVRPLAIVSGVGAITIVIYGWLSEIADYTRDDKVHIFTKILIATAVVAVILALLVSAKPSSKTPAAEVAA